jgi:hypothetical protein
MTQAEDINLRTTMARATNVYLGVRPYGAPASAPAAILEEHTPQGLNRAIAEAADAWPGASYELIGTDQIGDKQPDAPGHPVPNATRLATFSA